jgi:hypothetical protein
MDKASFERFVKLQEELQASEGWKWHVRIGNLATSLTIFRRNTVELMGKIQWFERMEESSTLLDLKNRQELYSFFAEVNRLHHNFLCSVYSLKEHTLRIVEQMRRKGVKFEEYDAKKKEVFTDSPLAKFVQQSREYITHNECIQLGSVYTWEVDAEEELSIVFDIEEMRKWKEWKSMSRKFMNSQGKDLQLKEVVKQYSQSVEEFYLWFYQKATSLLRKDIGEAESLMKEIERLESQGSEC